jgi:hypothetical protein
MINKTSTVWSSRTGFGSDGRWMDIAPPCAGGGRPRQEEAAPACQAQRRLVLPGNRPPLLSLLLSLLRRLSRREDVENVSDCYLSFIEGGGTKRATSGFVGSADGGSGGRQEGAGGGTCTARGTMMSLLGVDGGGEVPTCGQGEQAALAKPMAVGRLDQRTPAGAMAVDRRDDPPGHRVAASRQPGHRNPQLQGRAGRPAARGRRRRPVRRCRGPAPSTARGRGAC